MNLIAFIVLSLIATISTFEISKSKHFSNTRASAFITILMILVLRGINLFYHIESHLSDFDALIFASSFAGMSSIEKYSVKDMFIVAIGLAMFFALIQPHEYGVGGALGASAFICSTIYYYLKRVVPVLR